MRKESVDMKNDPSEKRKRIQVFPGQSINLDDVPPDEDFDIVLLRKQVLRIQCLAGKGGDSGFKVQAASDSRSGLHYLPAKHASGEEACLVGEGPHEVWVNRPEREDLRFTVRGFSSPIDIKIPNAFLHPEHPLELVFGEAFKTAGEPYRKRTPGSSEEPDADLDDCFLAIPDPTGRLHGRFKEGVNEVEGLTDDQKDLLRSLLVDTVSTAGQVWDSKDLLRDFGLKGRFYLKQNGKQQTAIIFQGYPGLRRFFRTPRYIVEKNPARFAVLTITRGPWHAVKAGLPSWSGGARVGIIFAGMMELWDWWGEDEAFISDLLVSLGSTALKTVLIGAAASLILAAAAAIFRFGGSVFAMVSGAVVVGIGVGWLVESADDRFGITESAKAHGRMVQSSLQELWREMIEKPVCLFMAGLEREIAGEYGAPFISHPTSDSQ
jgi:hypothetical protein